MSTYRAWGMDTDRALGWWERAACKGEHPPVGVLATTRDATSREQNRRAIAICGGCPVAATCLAEAERLGSTGVIAAGIKLGNTGPTPVVKTRLCRRVGCNTMFTTRVPNALYCGDPCRKKVRHAQEMARIRAYKARQRAKVGV